jgi:putative ABC transport system permease protein
MASGTQVGLAWRILVHDRKRFVWSVLGVSFAVLLMFVEMGFYHGSYDSVTLPVEAFDADLIMVNRLKEDMYPIEPFELARLAQARGFDGVQTAYPVYSTFASNWKNSLNGAIHPVRVMAFDPAHRVWKLPSINAGLETLQRPNTCLFDSRSREQYGTLAVGEQGELEGRRVRIGGLFSMGPDIVIDGTVLMSSANFANYFPNDPGQRPTLDGVDFGVLKLAPGAEPELLAQALMQTLPGDILVVTPADMIERIHAYWRQNQPVGEVFLTGLVVGFVIGVMICYQVLFTEIADNLPQYATLKAIGYPNGFLVGCVLRQGLYLALIGFAGGGLAALATYTTLERISSLPMEFQPLRVVLVLVATVAMCVTAASIALGKVLRSDPAEVF